MSELTGIAVPGRSCEGCAMCCMIMTIKALNKPKSTWCRHCSTKKSCDIYEQRPGECQNFFCGYLSFPELGEEWKPSRSKIVLAGETDGRRITAYVDPNRPDAWKKEPFYSTLKKWAKAAAPRGGQIVVCVDEHMFVLFPERNVDLGIVSPDHRIITGIRQTPAGFQLDAYSVHKDDPRAKEIAGAKK
jgi:hypothetical protein